jgi:diguanylate cyclase (GGDEF)-like protein
MPNIPAQQGKLSATLVLDDAVELAGQISSMMDGRLRLDRIQPVGEPDAPDAINTEPGSFATLSLCSRTDSLPEPLEDARVKISRLHKDSLTLEFSPPDSDVAMRYREAITAQTTFDSPDVAEPAESGDEAETELPAAEEPPGKAAPTGKTAPPVRGQLTSAVSADYARMLDSVRDKSLDELGTALKPFLIDLIRFLQELASQSRDGNQAQNAHYYAAVTLQGEGPYIARQMLQQVTDYFSDLTPDASEDHLWQYAIGSTDQLHLIDLEEFEDFLAIERTVSAGEELHGIALEALTVRLAALIGADPNLVRLPMSVRQLCRAFQSSLQQYELPHIALSDIFDYFGKLFVGQLEGFYAPLNTLLADQGIRPDVEAEIETKGSLLERNRQSHQREAKVRERRRDKPPEEGFFSSSQQELEAELSRILGGPSPARLYRSVIDALNFKREAEGLADGNTVASGVDMSGTWEGATVASTELDQSRVVDAGAIARALTALQRSAQAREEVQKTESLRAYLAERKNEISALKDSSGLTTDSLNQLDMVDNLFGTIKSQLDVSTDLKPSLGNLQIPLAKLALLDQKFFVDREHSARAVIDKLSSLATSGNFPNRALEDRINDIVDIIVRDYEHDETIFDGALDKIDRLVAQQERALERNKDRVIRTQEGQQKLAVARKAVGNLISDRLRPPTVPRVLQELIDGGWRDLLVLTHVKEGPGSEAWEEQVKALDQLCLWLDERRHGDDDEDLSVQRSLEAEPFLDLIEQQISGALPTNIAHEEVLDEIRDILAGNLEVEVIPVQPEDPGRETEAEEVRARIEDLPRLRRWIKRVEELEKDSWLTYEDRQGQKKRMQLVWTSPERDRYIFVNERGQKVADLSAVRLARQLSRGVQPPTPTDELSVVDQSMYNTLEHVQKSLSFARNRDSLTKMINRETFNNQLARALRHSQLKHAQHAVLYLNIDQFKLVNEVYDHVSGDQVLLEFAKLLAQLHSKKSSSARLDGDEFAVLLLDQSLEQAVETAEKIRADIESGSVDIDGESVSFTVSIGVAAILEHSSSVEEVLEAARSAMQHAKQRGRNQVVRYEEEHSRIIDYKREKTRTRKSLEDAIASEHFVLRAQPIMQTQVSDRSNAHVHYELLLGLLGKDGSISSPAEFIKSAERYGFMTLVDRWVIREAFTWISRLMDQQKIVPHLAINLSGTSVTDNSFMEYLLEQISEFGVGTSRLCFEITETGTISNLVKAADFVRAFRNIGCKFSIDDFGTGLASHNYLRELPVDYVKIDGSFITGIDKNRSDYAMARSINDLAHFLGQQTIAESVETDTIIVKLEELGVDYLQGWGVGRPRPLADVTAELSSLEQ